VERSKVPSWRCWTGMERGASSDLKTAAKPVRAGTRADSTEWKAGERLGIIEGVRMRTEGNGWGVCDDVDE